MKEDLERINEQYYYLNRDLFFWHLSRYDFAMKYINRDDIVVDIACGEGYGSKLLSSLSKEVIAIDIDENIIERNKQKYPIKNIKFITGNAVDFSKYIDHKVDVIISFETIEHLRINEQKCFLNEIRRVSKDNSIVIISSPNRTVYSADKVSSNPYHKHEMDLTEYIELLSDYFEIINIFGQKYFNCYPLKRMSMKLIRLLSKIVKPSNIFTNQDFISIYDFEFTNIDLDKSLIFIAVCRKNKKNI